MVVTLGLVFTACGKKDDDSEKKTPETPEVFVTKDISFDEYTEFLQTVEISLLDGYKATHKTTWADGSTDTATQLVNFENEQLASSMIVEGDNNYSAYIYENYVYYEEGGQKLSCLAELVNKVPEFKTAKAYAYMSSAFEIQDYGEHKIYDGSLFEHLDEMFIQNYLQFKKIYSDKHTQIQISYEFLDLQFTYTLYFTGTTFTGVDIEFKREDQFTRTTKIERSEETIEFPSFADFEAELGDEKGGDTWNPNDD